MSDHMPRKDAELPPRMPEAATIAELRAELARVKADAAAAMAVVVERAAEQADPWDGPVTKNKIVDAQSIAAQQIKARIRAIADVDGLAEVQALRAERDAATAMAATAYGASLNWEEILKDEALWFAQDDIGKSRIASMAAEAERDTLAAEVQALRAERDPTQDGYVKVIEVEKLLCAKLGVQWSAAGISITSLIDTLATEVASLEAQVGRLAAYGPPEFYVNSAAISERAVARAKAETEEWQSKTRELTKRAISDEATIRSLRAALAQAQPAAEEGKS